MYKASPDSVFSLGAAFPARGGIFRENVTAHFARRLEAGTSGLWGVGSRAGLKFESSGSKTWRNQSMIGYGAPAIQKFGRYQVRQ